MTMNHLDVMETVLSTAEIGGSFYRWERKIFMHLGCSNSQLSGENGFLDNVYPAPVLIRFGEGKKNSYSPPS